MILYRADFNEDFQLIDRLPVSIAAGPDFSGFKD